MMLYLPLGFISISNASFSSLFQVTEAQKERKETKETEEGILVRKFCWGHWGHYARVAATQKAPQVWGSRSWTRGPRP